MKKILFVLFVFALFMPLKTFARENVDYWYIKNFDSDITINKDSSLIIDEKIAADCGECIDKHGIFRILPTFYSPESGKQTDLHIKLLSITDFNGNAYKYSATNDRINKTITWKIGDANKTVQGVNDYEIKYSVANGVRTDNQDFDEFYWNLNGNFWDIETDQFTANIKFPDGVTQENVKISLYTGTTGNKSSENATSKWLDANTLQIRSVGTLGIGEGITLSAAFPKGFVTPYQPSFFEIYGKYLYFLITIFVFLFCLVIWRKFGRDPKINTTIAPEFDIPDKLSPMSLGMVYSDGILKTHFISASIIDLAVKKALKIEEIEKKGVFSSKDFKLTRLSGKAKSITSDEEKLLGDLFGAKDEILMSDLKNNFYTKIPSLGSMVKNDLVEKNYLMPYSRVGQILFIVAGVLLFMGFFISFVISAYLAINVFLSSATFIIFSFLMPQRPLEGAKFYYRVLGFKLYLNTAEKYRQRFFEKENLFERFLPYAMMFGMTEMWIKKMKDIYGEKYFATYHPIWYIGSISSFNESTFNSMVTGMSQHMSSTISSSPSSSGVGGGGFSGGGGGGGGGGGW